MQLCERGNVHPSSQLQGDRCLSAGIYLWPSQLDLDAAPAEKTEIEASPGKNVQVTSALWP